MAGGLPVLDSAVVGLLRQLSAEALPVLLSLEVTTLRGRGPMAVESLV